MPQKTEFEHVPWLEVWSTSPERAREMFGLPADTLVVVLKDGPETEREKERYRPEAKLYGLRERNVTCSCAGCRRHLRVVP